MLVLQQYTEVVDYVGCFEHRVYHAGIVYQGGSFAELAGGIVLGLAAVQGCLLD